MTNTNVVGMIKAKGIDHRVMTITPEMATQWLEGNVHNRDLRQGDVEDFAAQMHDGTWALNGESIIFSSRGKLLDGQHRLWACVEAGVSFESIVVFGIAEETFTTIDQGRHRSAADNLRIAHVVDGVNAATVKTAAAVANLVIKYRTNAIFSNAKTRPQQIVDLVKKEPQIVEYTMTAKRAPKGLRGFATPIAAVMHIGSDTLPEKAAVFMHRWITGADLQEGSPILTLRQRVLTNTPGLPWARFFLAAAVWNAHVHERQMARLPGVAADRFPQIEGDKQLAKRRK